MTETWKDIPGYGGAYQVSSEGRIRGVARFDARGRRIAARVLRQKTRKNGYLEVSLSDAQGAPKSRLVHRLVLAAFLGESDLEGNHRNGVKTDNRLGNLEWVTPSGNVRHAKQVLGHGRGDRAPSRILTAAQVEEIRRSFVGRKGEVAELARRYGVHFT